MKLLMKVISKENKFEIFLSKRMRAFTCTRKLNDHELFDY